MKLCDQILLSREEVVVVDHGAINCFLGGTAAPPSLSLILKQQS